MDLNEFAERIFLNLPYSPNDQQIEIIAALARFCAPQSREYAVFLLSGYAGTGKTSLVSALVKALREAMVPVVLMAPTGRAAKVFGGFAGIHCSTIHRRIYRPIDMSNLTSGYADVAENSLTNAVFIVDEASMIGDDASESHSSLLDDLVQYVYSGEGCRMILLGDTAQLPPVGCKQSPAMQPDRLRSLGLKVTRATLTKVVRQKSMSGILYNATMLRKEMRKDPVPPLSLCASRFADVEVVDSYEILDTISSAYSERGEANVLAITSTNRRAAEFNRGIRSQIFYRDEELCRDERIMISKNNYLWSAKVKGLDFIANGDMAVVEHIYQTETKYGCRFADVNLLLPDRDISFDCKILLDTLNSEFASLDPVKANSLYMAIANDPDLFTPSTPMRTRMRILRSDPYLNALQVKYAYCVTCHKSQGGQWDEVFIDLGFTPADTTDLERLRWTYTAITRATKKLWLINPPADTIS